MEKWAQHRTTDDADDNVARYGSWAIRILVTEDTRAPWLAAGAERVLRGIAADTSGAYGKANSNARDALEKLGV